ncbi:MAG: hypothetical protein VKL39_15540, partial [Leptolyngbyaceae bacterium]|nr:hypothetical protein [Leptolyngbyaceae bacterium]
MDEFHPLSEFIEDLPEFSVSPQNGMDENVRVEYVYSGRCPETGMTVSLPRTPEAEAIARSLMRQLSNTPSLTTEGKMFGVLLVIAPDGRPGVLKAFSGLLNGQNVVPGWVPPIPGREQIVVEEERTVARLDAIQAQLIALRSRPEREDYDRWQ